MEWGTRESYGNDAKKSRVNRKNGGRSKVSVRIVESSKGVRSRSGLHRTFHPHVSLKGYQGLFMSASAFRLFAILF